MRFTVFYLFLFLNFIRPSHASAQSNLGDLVFLHGFEQPRSVCSYSDLEKAGIGQDLLLVCDIDLKGQTLNLAPNLTVRSYGSIIFGGTVVLDQTLIEGLILNHDLTIEGEGRLIDLTYVFDPSKWPNIIQGEVTADQAHGNNQMLEDLFFLIHELYGRVFKIDIFDAYFLPRITPPANNAYRPSIEAVNLPSNFHLMMSDNTNMRVYPTSDSTREEELEGGGIFAIRDVDNVIISGGTLHGDRDTRYYSPDDNGLEGSHLLIIEAGRNVIIDSVRMVDGSKGGIDIHSLSFAHLPTYNPTISVEIRNCDFENLRRMSIALTDGADIRVLNNRFINTGQPSSHSDGGEVGSAINVEPVRQRDKDGNLIELQRVDGFTISGNTESGSRNAFVVVTSGYRGDINNNLSERRIGFRYASETIISNNVLRGDFNGEGVAISAAGFESDLVFGNSIIDNDIQGYGLGISISTRGIRVEGNEIRTSVVGMQISKTLGAEIVGNSIIESSRGIRLTRTYADDIEIFNNDILDTTNVHIELINLNADGVVSEPMVNIYNNFLTGDQPIDMTGAHSVNLLSNTLEGSIRSVDNVSVDVLQNTVVPLNRHGIELRGFHQGVNVLNNRIFEPQSSTRLCMFTDLDPGGVIEISNNTCE